MILAGTKMVLGKGVIRMWIRFVMMGVAAFFSVTAVVLTTFQGVEFGHALLDLLRDFLHNKT